MTITSTSTGQEHFAEWISAGAKAVAAQQTKSGHWSIQLKDNQGHTKTFANLKQETVLDKISQGELSELPFPTLTTPPKQLTEFPHSFDECMEQADAEIVDAHLTKLGSYAVHVSIPGLEGTKAFTNLAPKHLSDYFDLSLLREEEEETEQQTPIEPGHTFAACMKKGARVVDGHATRKGTYAIHVEMPGGKKKSFSSLSEATITAQGVKLSDLKPAR